ncbi:MAG: leucine-rich repeat domain-containing protein [Clostridia bacterium]|nr:leucine-rich repeat domain-containing protein [Clostridia bacterium]
MKKNRLHILATFFSIMLIALFSLSANAYISLDEDDLTKTVDNVKYHMFESEGEKRATAYDFVASEEMTELNILSEVDGYKVTSIEAITSKGEFPNVSEVTIGENVKYIDYRAFYNMDALEKVTLPSTLTHIEEQAFYSCDNLTTINLDSVKFIGTDAFGSCINLKEITFSESIETIGTRSFNNTGLEKITIPATASLSCTASVFVEFAQFSNCENLTEVIFEKGERTSLYIPQSAFSGCSSLKKVVLPDNITELSLGDYAFANCKSIESFDFSYVVEIDDSVFLNCSKLTKAEFSDELKSIGCHAFENTGLKKVVIPSGTVLKCCLSGEYEHGDDTGAFKDFYAQFKNCKNLKTVIFEDKTTSKFTIPHFTFEGCTALKKVYLPEDTKITIGPRAFKNCTSLTRVYGSENIVEIGDAAFSYCKSLKEITLGKNLKTVGEKAFLGCSKLARVNLESTKTAPTFGRKAFSATADGIKFVADKAIAKKVKTNLKNTATKNAKVYSVSYSKV